ncbi:hypothetical protein PGT21_008309 [Puccinia graminis f. sp. tritici]|uniref:Uncharacterized protein n=1 Tax=Puccinia graminis f. sp. tritici TaxID=56615 RepID=A0A5B0ME42_PUCGR|nr:hypothetical protein PGT21_008309 [Puccinia graminis f. sp. tritici]
MRSMLTLTTSSGTAVNQTKAPAGKQPDAVPDYGVLAASALGALKRIWHSKITGLLKDFNLQINQA